MTETITGHIVDIEGRRTYPGRVCVEGEVIAAIEEVSAAELGDVGGGGYLLPGFIDAHVHVESSMLTPSAFAAGAVVHGTVATVSDPHEIANVLGVDGVRFMLDDAARVPLKILFGAPSCVPATGFETAGAAIDVSETEALLRDPRIGYLAEMMNWPGVLAGDAEVLAKIASARALGKPVDGHAPGLRGGEAKAYFAAGIATDHECFTIEEGREKLACDAGVKIQIREGSAARNLEALWPLVDEYPGRVMLCSDDKHPNDLMHGHINALCARLIDHGCDLFNVLRAACVVPVGHYELEVGQMRVGDRADFVAVDDLVHFRVVKTWIDGAVVAEEGRARFVVEAPAAVNRFACDGIGAEDLAVRLPAGKRADDVKLRVIVADDGELVTRSWRVEPKAEAGLAVADVGRDILKIVVVNRYERGVPAAVGFVRGFGFRRGAIAGSVAHDSHNIVAVGASDAAIATVVNAVAAEKGGLAATDGETTEVLGLPIAGLMSRGDCGSVAGSYEALEAMARDMGSTLRSPFMTLSFMALLVIPELKLSDRGLFDGRGFDFAGLFED